MVLNDTINMMVQFLIIFMMMRMMATAISPEKVKPLAPVTVVKEFVKPKEAPPLQIEKAPTVLLLTAGTRESKSLEQWEREIEQNHPIISYYPRERWPEVARFNGWLPLPPEGS